MNAEIEPTELKRERAKLCARCRALTLEQRQVIEEIIQGRAEATGHAASALRYEALRKCASLQVEFLRAAAELRLLGERLSRRLAEASSVS